MKNNQDKLNDALGMVDESTVQGAIAHANTMKAAGAARVSRRAILRRRAAVVAAACLTLALMAGAILAVPLLTADEPAGTDEPANVTQTPPVEEFYVNAPIVKLTLLSDGETAEISDPDIPTESLGVTIQQTGNLRKFNIMTFDCEPGETVTVRASSECLAYIGMPYNRDTNVEFGGEFYTLIDRCTWGGGPLKPAEGFALYTDSVTIDPANACIRVELPYGLGNRVDEEILTFTVTNENGQITGTGSILVKTKDIMSEENSSHHDSVHHSSSHNSLSAHTDWFRITRSGVLGSVRFTDPAAVTEDSVRELQESFAARAEDVRAELDFSPKLDHEGRIYIHSEIIREACAPNSVHGLGCSWGDGDYSCFRVDTGSQNDQKLRHFVIFGDGTWAEILTHDDCNKYPCHLGCPNAEEYGEHHGWTLGCCLTTTDGRIYELQQAGEDDQRTFVLIHDPAA